MSSVEANAQQSYCRSKKMLQPVYGIFKEKNDTNKNFISNVIAHEMDRYLIQQVLETSVHDSDLDRAYFRYQVLKFYAEPKILAAARESEAGKALFTQYIKELKEAEKEVKEEADKIRSAAGLSKPTEEEKREAKVKLLDALKKDLGGILHLPPVNAELKKIEGTLNQKGGGKSKFKRQAGERASYQAQRRLSYKVPESRVKDMGMDQLRQYLKLRREALKGIKKDLLCAMIEAAKKLEQDEEFMRDITTGDSIDYDKGLETLSKRTGIKKPSSQVVKTIFGSLNIESKDIQIKKSGGGRLYALLLILLSLCVAINASAFGHDAKEEPKGYESGKSYSIPRWTSEGNMYYDDYIPWQFKPGGQTVFVRPGQAGGMPQSQQLPKQTGVRNVGGQIMLKPAGVTSGQPLVPGTGFIEAGGQIMANPAGGAFFGSVLPLHIPAAEGRASAGSMTPQEVTAALDLTFALVLPNSEPTAGSVLQAWSRAATARDVALAQMQTRNITRGQFALVDRVLDVIGLGNAPPENTRQAGERTLNMVRTGLASFTGAVNEVISNPESAGISPVMQLASLQTILSSFQVKHANIKYTETSDENTVLREGSFFSEGSARDINFMNEQQTTDFMRRFSEGSTWDGKEYHLGSITVVKGKTAVSTRFKQALGVLDKEQAAVEPNTIYISVIHKPSANIQERIDALKRDRDAIQKDKKKFLENDNVRKIEENILNEESHLALLRYNAAVIKSGAGVTRAVNTTVKRTALGIFKSLLGDAWSGVQGAINQVTKTTVENAVDTVRGESEANRKARQARYDEVNRDIQNAEPIVAGLKAAKAGIKIQIQGYDTRNKQKEKEINDAISEKLRGPFEEHGVIVLNKQNFDRLAPLVRRFLNKDNATDVRWALEYCDNVKQMVDPRVAGLYMYNELTPTASTLLLPSGISNELKTAIQGFQRGYSLQYRTALDTCLLNNVNAFTSLASIGPQAIQEYSSSRGLVLNPQHKAALTGAVALATQLAVSSVTVFQDTRAAASPENAIAIIQDSTRKIAVGPFEEKAKNNLGRMVENIVISQGQNILRLVNDTATEAVTMVGGFVSIPGRIVGPIVRSTQLIMIGTLGAGAFILGMNPLMMVPQAVISLVIGLGEGFVEDYIAQNYGIRSSKSFAGAMIAINLAGILLRLNEERKRRNKQSTPTTTVKEESVPATPKKLGGIEEKSFGWFSKAVWVRRYEAIIKNIKTLYDLREKREISIKAKKESICKHIDALFKEECSHYKTHTELLGELAKPSTKILEVETEHRNYLELMAGLAYLVNAYLGDGMKKEKIETIYEASTKNSHEDVAAILPDGQTLDALIANCKSAAQAAPAARTASPRAASAARTASPRAASAARTASPRAAAAARTASPRAAPAARTASPRAAPAAQPAAAQPGVSAAGENRNGAPSTGGGRHTRRAVRKGSSKKQQSRRR